MKDWCSEMVHAMTILKSKEWVHLSEIYHYVAILWREPAMIVTNAVLGSVGIGCLTYNYFIT